MSSIDNLFFKKAPFWEILLNICLVYVYQCLTDNGSMAKVKQIGIRLDADTLERLTALTQDGKLSQAQVITEAIEVLSANKPPAKDLIERLDTLAQNDAELKKVLGQIHDLLYQVLRNQQEKGS
jgi:hypothetical protein